jgi:hypothetical protein
MRYASKGSEMPLSPDDIITKSPGMAQRIFEEKMLVITAKDSMLHRFNEVGTFVWSTLDNAMSLNELCGSVENNFKGFDRKKSQKEIVGFLLTLEKKNLVSIQRK